METILIKRRLSAAGAFILVAFIGGQFLFGLAQAGSRPTCRSVGNYRSSIIRAVPGSDFALVHERDVTIGLRRCNDGSQQWSRYFGPWGEPFPNPGYSPG